MDATLLTSQEFWDDPAPVNAIGCEGIPELEGHVLFETSGSSGTPKQVALSKTALRISAGAVNRHLAVTRDSRWGLALPLQHVGGFGVAARAFEAGCKLYQFDGRWNAIAFRKWLEQNAVTHTSLVPTQVHDLVTERQSAPPCLKAIVVGGGHLDTSIGRAARDLGWPVLASYGMTEAGSQIATQGLELLDAPYQSAPISLLPIWEARLSDDQRLCISGPALFSGTVSDGILTPRESAWHVTSDLVFLENRAISPLGRADSLVKILGELVDPEAIERELLALSQVRLTPGTIAILALPDERAGHVLVPVFDDGVDPQTVDLVVAEYNRRAPGFRRLQPASATGPFPRGGLGKLRRNELATLYQQQVTARPARPA